MDKDLKSCQLIAAGKFNLLRKIHFLLKSSFQVIAFFIFLEIFLEIFFRIFCYNCRKLCLQMNATIIFGTLQINV